LVAGLVTGASGGSEEAGSPPTSPVASVAAQDESGSVYAHAGAGMLAPVTEDVPYLVYVPNSESDTVDVVDPETFEVVRGFPVGGLPQHVTPSYDLETLYVNSNTGNTLQRIDPATGEPDGEPIPVEDPYNLYFTPDGGSAIVVAERLARLDFRDPETMELRESVEVPCPGVNHMDFSADGSYLIASCEFGSTMIRFDLERMEVTDTLTLADGGGKPQDVRLSPDGETFYVADELSNGVWAIDAPSFEVRDFIETGEGAHGLYPSRDAEVLYASNRGEGSVSVIDLDNERVEEQWPIPGGGSPDMGGVSPDGGTLWLTGRYDGELYALDTGDGELLARIPVGAGPHGAAVWPQPGRYSLGHTGNTR
jgi:YVTN family beta-propeller protein